MRNDASADAAIGGIANRLAIENEILNLFAPGRHSRAAEPLPGGKCQPVAWHEDAIHRARNLAQLTRSLATLAEHSSRSWLPPHLVVQAHHLAAAYLQLGLEEQHGPMVPCTPLLTEVATRLVLVFGAARRIEISITAPPVILNADMRRNLVLMCSDIVINALKYAFPGGARGQIRVALIPGSDDIELVVEDDGIDHGAGSIDGPDSRHGKRLMAELATLGGAAVGHGPGRDGAGCRVTCRMPLVPQPA